MSRKLLPLISLVAVVAALAGYYTYGSRRTPSGQPPLASLEPATVPGFLESFNAAADSLRVLAFFSPT